MIVKALAGSLPRDRELRYYEPKRLDPTHIEMVLDRASGLNVKEVTEKHGYASVGRVSQILCHPDAQTLLSTLLSAQADRVLDVNERLIHLAPEALNVRVELMRHSKSEMIQEKVSSDILDRAGYTPKRKIEVESKHTLMMSAQAAAQLASVMEESKCVGVVDYTEYLAKSAGGEGTVEPRLLPAPLAEGTGHTDLSNEASLVPPSADLVSAPIRKSA